MSLLVHTILLGNAISIFFRLSVFERIFPTSGDSRFSSTSSVDKNTLTHKVMGRQTFFNLFEYERRRVAQIATNKAVKVVIKAWDIPEVISSMFP